MIDTKQTVDIKNLELNNVTSFCLELVSTNISSDFLNLIKENFLFENIEIKWIFSDKTNNKHTFLFKNHSLENQRKREVTKMKNSEEHLCAFISTVIFLYKKEIKSITLKNLVYSEEENPENSNKKNILYLNSDEAENKDRCESRIITPNKRTVELSYHFFFNLVKKNEILYKKIHTYLIKVDYDNKEITYVSEFINIEMLLLYKYGRKESILYSIENFLGEANMRNVNIEGQDIVVSRYLVDARNAIVHGNNEYNYSDVKLETLILIAKEINLLILMNLMQLDSFYTSQKLSTEKYVRPYWAKEKFEIKIASIKKNNTSRHSNKLYFLKLIRMFNSLMTDEEEITIFHYIPLDDKYLVLIEVNQQVFTFYTKDYGESFKLAFTDEFQWLTINKEKYQKDLLSYKRFIVKNLKIEAKKSQYKSKIIKEFVSIKNEVINQIKKTNTDEEKVYSISCELKDFTSVNFIINKNDEQIIKLNKNEKFSSFINFAKSIKNKKEQELSLFLDENAKKNNLASYFLFLLIDKDTRTAALNLLKAYKNTLKNKMTINNIEEAMLILIQNKVAHVSTYQGEYSVYRVYLKKKIEYDYKRNKLYTLDFDCKNVLIGIQENEYDTIEWSEY